MKTYKVYWSISWSGATTIKAKSEAEAEQAFRCMSPGDVVCDCTDDEIEIDEVFEVQNDR